MFVFSIRFPVSSLQFSACLCRRASLAAMQGKMWIAAAGMWRHLAVAGAGCVVLCQPASGRGAGGRGGARLLRGSDLRPPPLRALVSIAAVLDLFQVTPTGGLVRGSYAHGNAGRLHCTAACSQALAARRGLLHSSGKDTMFCAFHVDSRLPKHALLCIARQGSRAHLFAAVPLGAWRRLDAQAVDAGACVRRRVEWQVCALLQL